MKTITIFCFFLLITLLTAQLRLELNHHINDEEKEDYSNFDEISEEEDQERTIKNRLLATKKSTSTNPSTTLPVMNSKNVQYWTTILVGANKQPMKVILDTGSAWLWMQASDINSNFGSNHFNCSASKTCNQTNTPAQCVYTKGGIYGNLTYDSIDLGNGFVVKNQGFNLVHKTVNFGALKSDGFWGLTPNHPKNTPTLMDNLKAQGVISDRAFSLYLTSNFTSVTSGSVMIIGGYDASLMSDTTFSNIPLKANYKYWTVNIQSFSLGSTKFSMNSPHTILDCGANYMDVASVDWPDVFAAIQSIDSNCNKLSNGLVGCPCKGANDYLKFPNMTWNLGNPGNSLALTMTPAQYINVKSGVCVLGIRSKKGTVTRLGAQFMKNWYMNFDIDQRTVGFAKFK